MSATKPTWAEVISSAINYRLQDLHTAIPARVEAYHADTQTVDVQPVIKSVLVDPNGNSLVQEYPKIPSVPVAFPRAGGYFLSLPIAVGDTVLVIFCEHSIDVWRARGIDTTPGVTSLHGLSGAVAIPGVFPTNAPLSDAATNALVLGKDGGPQIKIDGTTIKAGASASDFVAMSNKVLSEINALKLIFNTHVHPGVTTGGGSTLVTATTMDPSTDVASTILKAE